MRTFCNGFLKTKNQSCTFLLRGTPENVVGDVVDHVHDGIWGGNATIIRR